MRLEDLREVLPYASPERVRLMPAPDLGGLDLALVRYTGTYLNANGVRLDDFDVAAVALLSMQIPGRPSIANSLNVVFRHKRTKRLHIADLRLIPWAEFMTISGELSNLAQREET
jgi:hypothetical protein